jgi:predicted metal-dependent HD superfamily phosphohydrolase
MKLNLLPIPEGWSLSQRLGHTPLAQAWEVDLWVRYGEAQRVYHNQSHLLQVLARAKALQEEAEDTTAVCLALWFHDAVYDPRAPVGQNEQDSANLAQRVLAECGYDPQKTSTIAELILTTQHHQPQTADGRVVVDADLAILAAPPAEYEAYAAAIRQEYGWVPVERYVQGRTAVLQTFLNRPQFFYTSSMQAQTAIAHANLRRELTSLQA